MLRCGIYKPNEKIESVRELASILGINPNTVKKAYDELYKKGIIVSISTKGTFISNEIEIIRKDKIKEKINIIKKEINELENMRNRKRRNPTLY